MNEDMAHCENVLVVSDSFRKESEDSYSKAIPIEPEHQLIIVNQAKITPIIRSFANYPLNSIDLSSEADSRFIFDQSSSGQLRIQDSSQVVSLSVSTPCKKKKSLKLLLSFHSQQMVTDKNNRIDFIKKVYSLLSCQLFLNLIFVSIVISNDTLRDGIKNTTPVVITCFIGIVVLSVFIAFSKSFLKKYPQNFYTLFCFTLLESYMISYIASYYDNLSVLAAFVIALGVTISLTIYTFFISKDCTLKTSMIIAALSCIFFLGISLTFSYRGAAQTIYVFIVIVFYCFFIVYDTQLMAGGRFEEFTYDDYIIATLMLYLDIVGLFLYILTLLKGDS